MKTMAIETRLDVRRLAECCLVFERSRTGLTKSALVALCVDTLATIFKDNDLSMEVEDTFAAESIIFRFCGKRTVDVSGVRVKTLQEQVLEQTKPFEGD